MGLNSGGNMFALHCSFSKVSRNVQFATQAGAGASRKWHLWSKQLPSRADDLIFPIGVVFLLLPCRFRNLHSTRQEPFEHGTLTYTFVLYRTFDFDGWCRGRAGALRPQGQDAIEIHGRIS